MRNPDSNLELGRSKVKVTEPINGTETMPYLDRDWLLLLCFRYSNRLRCVLRVGCWLSYSGYGIGLEICMESRNELLRRNTEQVITRVAKN